MNSIPFIDLNYQTKIVEKNINSRWKDLVSNSSFVMGVYSKTSKMSSQNFLTQSMELVWVMEVMQLNC